MKAWVVDPPRRIQPVELPPPELRPDELRVRVTVCAVCRTDLHLAEGDLPPKAPGVVPGHEAVGTVEAVGHDATTFAVGDRVGVAWLRRTCGTCRECRRGAENLCPRSEYTGWDAHGGYAEQLVVPADYAYRLPDRYRDEEVAPLLCAGIIGYRALKRAAVPEGGSLGIYGFGASAHLAAQVAMAQDVTVHVLTRSAAARELAVTLGAASVGDARSAPPEPLDAAILFAPVGDVVPVAMEALAPGGTLAIAGIHLTDIPSLNYDQHLFRERQIRSVTANTRQDGHEFLDFAARHRLRVTTTPYPFDQADRALADLADGQVTGAAVLTLPS